MSKKELTAEWHWKDEWGTGFTKATLSEKEGLLEMSMDDIYNTMQSFAEHYHEVKSKEDKSRIKELEAKAESRVYSKVWSAWCALEYGEFDTWLHDKLQS